MSSESRAAPPELQAEPRVSVSENSSGSLPNWFWVVGSIVSTVAIVQVNKLVFETWPRVTTLTLIHFIIQFIGFEICGSMGLFEIKRLPAPVALQVSFAMAISILANNMSLDVNSVGFYQGSKLLVIPTVMMLEKVLNPSRTYSTKLKMAIVIVCAGMAVATVSDPRTSPLGVFICCIAVVSTGTGQIWIGTKQKEFDLSPINITHSIVGFMGAWVLFPALLFDGGLSAFEGCPIFAVIVSSFLGGSVNIFAYGIVGKMSPVAYQLVGNAKTILVILFGLILFPSNATLMQTVGNMLSLGIAISGMALYGHVKHKESVSEPDVIDQYCPNLISALSADYQILEQQSIPPGTTSNPEDKA